jgi:uncharacterized protein
MFLYLHGFASGPGSAKAQYFRRRLDELGIPLQIPALDEGDFEHLSLSRQLRLIEGLTRGARPLVIIGSSLGGYLAALHAAAHPVSALVLLAPAFDFARRWRERLGEAALEAWRQTGACEVDHHATGQKERLSYELMADASRHAPYPTVSAPALVLHGRKDEVVPEASVAHWAAHTQSARMMLFDAGHELTECLAELFEEARRFLSAIPEVAAAYPGVRG